MVFGAGTGLGFLMTVLIPIGFEYGTAISYPADEAAVTGVLECAAEFGSFIMITLVGTFTEVRIVFNMRLMVCLYGSLVMLWVGVQCESK